MALTWILTEIETEVRELIGAPGILYLNQAAIFNWINDFYRNVFPGDIYDQQLESWWTFDTADSDTGSTETLPETVFTISGPMTIKDSDDNILPIDFYSNKSTFYNIYPEDSADEEDERSTPASALLYNRIVELRPKADAVFTFKAASKIKPDALTAEVAPLNIMWGPAITYGTAAMLMLRKKDHERASELGDVYRGLVNVINKPNLIQKSKNTRAIPRF